MKKISAMNNDDTIVHEPDTNNFNTSQTAITQPGALNEYGGISKGMCIIFSIIVVILIISIIVNILTIIIEENTNTAKSVTATMATTEASLTVTMTITEAYVHSSWSQYGITITGGQGLGFELEKLYNPKGIDIDDDGSVYIADVSNHRIVRRAPNTTNGECAAGGNNAGNRIDQLNGPSDVVIDKKKNSLIICDQRNRRVMRWSLRNPIEPQIIISNIDCSGLAIDSNGAVYVSDFDQSAVKRWREGESNGAIVAGGNGKGGRLNQLNYPTYLFVDQDYSVYVSDTNNNRVMKWMKDAKEGIIVAGGNGQGHNVAQLFLPRGLIVDRLSNVYVADCMNNRVVCWSKGSQEVRIVVGGYGEGHNSHTLTDPEDISFDRQGNLYVVDYGNHRVQKFDVED